MNLFARNVLSYAYNHEEETGVLLRSQEPPSSIAALTSLTDTNESNQAIIIRTKTIAYKQEWHNTIADDFGFLSGFTLTVNKMGLLSPN